MLLLSSVARSILPLSSSSCVRVLISPSRVESSCASCRVVWMYRLRFSTCMARMSSAFWSSWGPTRIA